MTEKVDMFAQGDKEIYVLSEWWAERKAFIRLYAKNIFLFSVANNAKTVDLYPFGGV